MKKTEVAAKVSHRSKIAHIKLTCNNTNEYIIILLNNPKS